MTRALLVAFHVAALWPAGRWFFLRMTEGGGAPWGLAAAVAALVLVWTAPSRPPERPRLTVPGTLLVLSSLAWSVAPPLVAATLGALSLAMLATELRSGRLLDPAVLGLVVLATPDISTLQVFVGWPFRMAVTHCVAVALTFLGIDAAPQGTLLLIDGRAIAVDAPCSGVWMGWGAALAWLALAGMRRLGTRHVLAGLAALVPLVFVANALRALALALLESRPPVPGWVHEGVGIVVFALIAAGAVALCERLARREGRTPCALRSST